MQKLFVLKSSTELEIGTREKFPDGCSAGILLDPDYSGNILLCKDGMAVATDFQTIFGKVYEAQNYTYFSFHNPGSEVSALVHADVLRTVVADALFNVGADSGLEGNERVHEIAMEYLFRVKD